MEDIHRRAIQSNFVSLVEQTDLDLMVTALYEKGVFSGEMIEKYKDTRLSVRDRKRQMYMAVMLRGPDAFRHLTDSLQEAGYWNLARDLDPDSSLHFRGPQPQPLSNGENSFISIRMKDKKADIETQKNAIDENGPLLISNSQEGADSQECEPDDNVPHFNVIKSTKFIEDEGTEFKLYKTRGPRNKRGVLLAFSYIKFQQGVDEHRSGADVDAKKLKYLFSELGFKVFSYLNLTKEKTQDTLKLLNQVLAGAECAFIVVSSHGYQRGGASDVEFRCHDGQLMGIYEFLEYFNNERLPALIGIPKVFIFQLCRGLLELPVLPAGGAGDGTHRDGTAGARAGAEGGDLPPAPAASLQPPHLRQPPARLYSDMLIAHSTLPGYVSRRDIRDGSWYIQTLCSVFAEHAHEYNVNELFTLVDIRLRKQFHVQTSAVEYWGFNKRLYLHPGLYET
ncbi:unnamed protein product [Diatraea saccharalis]|uniref:Uncharacterized protein n=1 Tax=Diatraea saccharalis TaxID=40085 RepID=A0A9N9QUA3_9NEOP|nr:unnamed protein product [Diatraea saccharalis]